MYVSVIFYHMKVRFSNEIFRRIDGYAQWSADT